MKQKYVISKNKDKREISIQEYAELEKGEFAFVCEEIYDIDDFRNNMGDGANGLVRIVRRPNMYPRHDFAEKIAQEIIEFLKDEYEDTKREILINDSDDFIEAENDINQEVVYSDDAQEESDSKTDGESAGKEDGGEGA